MGIVEDAVRDIIHHYSREGAREVMGELTEKIDEIQEQLRALTQVAERMSGRVEELCEPRRAELTRQVHDLLEMQGQAMAAPPEEEKEPEGEEPVTEEEPEVLDFSPEELKKLRERLDLSQQELAELIEVSPITISSWETGKSSPRQASRERIEAVGSMDSEEVDEALGREHVPTEIPPAEMKSIRERLDLTQAELAELLGISKGGITSWETGRSVPSRENRLALLELSGTSREEVDERLGREHMPAEMPPAEMKSIRERLDLTQTELAELLGVSKGAVTLWETGKSVPSRENRLALLELSGRSREEVDERLGRETPPLAGPEVSPDDIRTFREELGLTQAEMAERLGVSANTISGWEVGRTAPRPSNLEKLRTLA